MTFMTNNAPTIIGIGHGYGNIKAVVAAVNDYFERQERLTADPYLESREKEDAFLQRVMEAVATGLQASGSQIRTPVSVSSPAEVDNEELSAALDFADGF
jgi:predicted NBD/HSP70 family sugar kinase